MADLILKVTVREKNVDAFLEAMAMALPVPAGGDQRQFLKQWFRRQIEMTYEQGLVELHKKELLATGPVIVEPVE